MPSPTSVVLTVRGVDQTRAVFKRVRANVALMASNVRMAATAAVATTATLAAALTGVAAATIAAAKAFGKLSDRAAQAGTTASDLDKLAHALSQAGVKNANIDAIADAFSRMAKATGRTGYEGFRETLVEISKIGDEGRRVAELSRVFGRSFGPGLAAAVRGGPDQLRASLDGIMELLPGLDNRVVAAGDAIADGFETAKRGVTQSIQTMLVDTADRAFKHFGVSARAAGLIVAGYAKVYSEIALRNLKTAWDWIVTAWDDLPNLAGAAFTIIMAKASDLFVEIGNGVGLVIAAVAALQLAIGNIPGAAILTAADVALAYGMEKMKEAGDAAKKDVDAAVRTMDEFRKKAGEFDFEMSDEQRKYIENLKKQAENYDKMLDGLGGSAGSGLAGALGPLRDAQAVLSSSYDAFRIASQRGLGGSNGGVSAARAAQTTAQNTGRMVTSLDQLSRNAQKAFSAFQGLPPVYVL